MDTTINEYSYELDSLYRTSGTNESPVFELPTNLLLSHPDNYFEVHVITARLPYSFYNVQSGTNSIRLILSVTGTAVISRSAAAVFPPGIYTITTLMAQLKTLLDQHCVDANMLSLPTFLVSYSALTGMVTVSITAMATGYNVRMSIEWPFSTTNIAQLFGFNTTAVVTWTSGGASVSATGINMANVSPVTSLEIRCSSLNQISKYMERLESMTWKNSNVLLSVPVNTTPMSWILHENFNEFCRLSQGSIYTLELYVTAGSDTAVNFNGIPWRTSVVIREKRAEQLVSADNELMRTHRQTPFKSNELMIDSNQSQPKRFRM
jgi:hypothetical protein